MGGGLPTPTPTTYSREAGDSATDQGQTSPPVTCGINRPPVKNFGSDNDDDGKWHRLASMAHSEPNLAISMQKPDSTDLEGQPTTRPG